MDMFQEVILKIQTKQIRGKDDEDVYEFVTDAQLAQKKESIYIMYDESELSGMKGTNTTIKVEKNQMSISRKGSNISKMIFKKNQHHRGLYQSQEGSLPMEILTNFIEIPAHERIFENQIVIDYDINLAGMFTGKNIMTIKIIQK